jgi:predicted amidophosphoribosyltransferase
MPDARRTTCQNCREHADKVGPISWRGYCAVCGPELAQAAASDLHYHRGPKFERWRLRLAASVGAVLVDDVSETG